jgi:hypothetical protein
MSIALIGFDPTAVYTAAEVTAGTPPYGYGDIAVDRNGNEYQFVRSDATGFAVAAACLITSTATVQAVASSVNTTNSAPGQVAAGGPIGVAMGTVAANGAGWLQVRGRGSVLVAASCVKGTVLNTTGTTGVLDDDATSGAEVINGLTLIATATGAAATACQLMYPSVGRTL